MKPKTLISISVCRPRSNWAMKMMMFTITRARFTTGNDCAGSVCRRGIISVAGSCQALFDLDRDLLHLFFRQLGENRDGQRRRRGSFRIRILLVCVRTSGETL